EAGDANEIVAYQDPLGREAWVKVIPPRDIESAADVDDYIVGNGDVAGDRPRRGTRLIARCDQNGETVLRFCGVILEGVAGCDDAPRRLELEQVLDHILCRDEGQRLDGGVVADFDIRGHKVRGARVGAAEHHVLAGGLDVVVADLEWAGRIVGP